MATFLLVGAAAAAHSGSPVISIERSTRSSAGVSATADGFVLRGSFGLPEAAGRLTASGIAVEGGYWPSLMAIKAPPPPPDPCPEDLDEGGDIGFGDVLAILAVWGPCSGCPEDLDGSGDVGFGDLLAVLSAWGACP